MQHKSTISSGRGWYVAFLSALTAAISAATASQFSATLAPLATQLGVTEEAVALTESIKSVFVVLAMLIAPASIKKWGWRTTFILSGVSFLVPQLLMPFVSSFVFLAVLKGLQGFSALLFPLALGLIVEWNESKSLGLATSIFTGVFYAGGALGGMIAGFSSALWGWRFSYHLLSGAMLLMSILYLMTISSREQSTEAAPQDNGAYRFVVRHKLTWFLIVAFLPTVWTIQAIWADMVPFGLGLGYTDTQTGSVMGLSSLAIVLGALLSGKTSDFFASLSPNRLKARISVFAFGALLIIAGVSVTIFFKPLPPHLSLFNMVVFFLSFGAAWGLGAFYCIFPEIYNRDQVNAANGFIGGLADMAMPMSPVVMALLGIRMNRWDWAWFSCILVAMVGLVFCFKIFNHKENKTEKQIL